MAILRTQLQGNGATVHRKDADGQTVSAVLGVYDGIIETAADLQLDRCTEFSPGSLLYCLADGRLYVKTGQGQWEVA